MTSASGRLRNTFLRHRHALLFPLVIATSVVSASATAAARPEAEIEQMAQDYASVVALLEQQEVARARPVLACLARRGYARAQALLSSVMAASGDLVDAWAWRSVAAYADPDAARMFLDSIALDMSAAQLTAAAKRTDVLRAKYGADATGVWCAANRRSDAVVNWQCQRTKGVPTAGSCVADSSVGAADQP